MKVTHLQQKVDTNLEPEENFLVWALRDSFPHFEMKRNYPRLTLFQ